MEADPDFDSNAVERMAGELKVVEGSNGGTGCNTKSVRCFLFGYKEGGLYVAVV